jgi:hypothetical protein
MATTIGRSFGTLCLTLYIFLHSSYMLAYIYALIECRHHFQAAIRLPYILVAFSIITLLVDVSVALRQILSDWGGAFPCALMTLCSIGGVVAIVATPFVRNVHLMVLFVPNLRRRFIKFVTPSFCLQLYLGLAGFGILIWAIVWKDPEIRLCYSR